MMPDGKRKRRFSANKAKRDWYALQRSIRFARRMLTAPLEAKGSNDG